MFGKSRAIPETKISQADLDALDAARLILQDDEYECAVAFLEERRKALLEMYEMCPDQKTMWALHGQTLALKSAAMELERLQKIRLEHFKGGIIK